MATVSIDGDVPVLEGLDDEVRHHAPVVRVHARAVGVEDPRHLHRHLVLAVVIEEQGLGATLAFVVTGTRADRIDVAPIVLRLRVNGGITNGPRRSRLAGSSPSRAWRAPACSIAPCTLVLVVCTGSNWSEWGMRDRRDLDFVDLHIEREADVVAQQLEARIRKQAMYVMRGRCTGLSTHRTSWPSCNSRSHKCEPIKPAPPVTSTRRSFNMAINSAVTAIT